MNLNKMMKQVAKAQAELAKATEALADEKVEGTSGGGAVKIVLTGDGELVDVSIDPSAADPDDPSLLEDLVLAAFNEANKAQKDLMSQRLGGLQDLQGLTGGMNIPGLT